MTTIVEVHAVSLQGIDAAIIPLSENRTVIVVASHLSSAQRRSAIAHMLCSGRLPCACAITPPGSDPLSHPESVPSL